MHDNQAYSSHVLKLRTTPHHQPSNTQASINGQSFPNNAIPFPAHTPLSPSTPPPYTRPPPAPSSSQVSLALPIVIRRSRSCGLPKSHPRREKRQIILLWLLEIASWVGTGKTGRGDKTKETFIISSPPCPRMAPSPDNIPNSILTRKKICRSTLYHPPHLTRSYRSLHPLCSPRQNP